MRKSWQLILSQDYKPVFEPALAVLNVLPDRPFVEHLINGVAECAQSTAKKLTDLGYDHAGPLYHKILPNARETGAFYTNNISALLLAKLALKSLTNWQDQQAIKKLRIMDPACGTGTLLMATVKTIKDYFIQANGPEADRLKHRDQLTALHKCLVENVIYGLDINQCAIQLAASNLTLGAPEVDYRCMNLFTMQHGPQSDSTIKAGSIDILEYVDHNSLQSLVQSTGPQAGRDSVQVNQEATVFPVKDLDLVIMNPPFTNNAKRSSRYSSEIKVRMQQKEKSIRDSVIGLDPEAGKAINFNAISTFFTPLADKLLHPKRGVLAEVIPATACTGVSGLAIRILLAKRFFIERIITSHDPKRPNFSENTGIQECLMVARRHNKRTQSLPTEFISLKRMPQTEIEVDRLVKVIEEDSKNNNQITRMLWPSERIKVGNWSPTQWCSSQLAEIAHRIAEHDNLEPAERRHVIGPAGQRINDAYQRCNSGDRGAKLIFRSISSKLRQTMLAEPEDWQCPKPTKIDLAQKYWQSRSHVLVATRFNTTVNRITAIWSDTLTVGNGFIPLGINNEAQGKGMVAWWNSTPAMLMLLNLRSKTFKYPKWSLAQLNSIGVPKPDNPAWSDLVNVFEENKNNKILPLKQAQECSVRKRIDSVAADVLGLPETTISYWRSMLSKEPTISNKKSP